MLGAYAWATLSAAEERQLHQAALEDQELFNALADEDLLREALEDEAFRQRLQRRLRELNGEGPVRGFASVLTGWFRRPAVVAAAGLTAVLLAVGIPLLLEWTSPGGARMDFEPAVQPGQAKGLPSARESEAGGRIGGESLERLWDLGRTGRDPGVELGLDRSGEVPRYAVGDRMRVGFSVPRDAVVVLLARAPGGAVTRLFPNRRRSSPLVGAGERVMVPRAGQGYARVAGPPGRHRLRLLAFPPGTDLPEAGLAGRGRPLAAERKYQVVRRRRGAE